MKKIIIATILIAGIVISASVFVLKNIKDQSKVAEVVNTSQDNKKVESEPEVVQNKIVKTGSFIKIDPLHYAGGEVEVVDGGDHYKLMFKNNFASAEGPDLYVYLSAPQEFKNRAVAGLDTQKTINLGVLKSITGSQEYLVSKADFDGHGAAVVIWCKEFNVQFSRADLK